MHNFFVTGSLSAYHSDGETFYERPYHTKDDSPIKNEIAITSAVGYMIPGKSYGFGLGLGYSHASEKDYDTYNPDNGDVLVSNYKKDCNNTINVSPFFRYAYARFDKITLYVDAKMPISIGKEWTKIGGSDVVDGNKKLSLGACLIPGLTYKFNSHILFTTEIGLLSLNYLHTKTTSPDENIVIKANDFKLGANTRQIASFGFVYLF